MAVGTMPVMFNFVKKYHMEYRNKYPPDEPADKNDLHHQL
jgi:hypothetical protein